jgi:hypothetical protein
MDKSPLELIISAKHAGVHYWDRNDGLMSAIQEALGSLGCQKITICLAGEPLPPDLDFIITLGPFGSLMPLANQLLAIPTSRRPKLVLWMTEMLPNPRLPVWLVNGLGRLITWAQRRAYRSDGQGRWAAVPWTQPFIHRMARFRYQGELRWLSDHGLLAVLAVGSAWNAEYFRRQGYDPVEAYLGHHPMWGRDLGLQRDIPVLWLGKYGSRRRERLVLNLEADLRRRGIEMMMVDGVHHPYIFGEQRTTLLNRTKIVVNLLRTPWDNHAIRFYLATTNRAMIISEPALPHTPFRPGVHLVEAPLEQLGDTIAEYLADDALREPFVERAYTLLMTEMSLECSLQRILERLAQV